MPYTVDSPPEAVKGLPQLGEIRHGYELGRRGKSLRYIWFECVVCHKARWVQFYGGQPCSKHCRQCGYLAEGALKRGENNPFWKGGRRKDKSGYIYITLQPDDFFYPMAKGRVVAEHRLIIAKNLNRCLLSWEVVHHRNGIKDDNRLENLQLLPNRNYHMIDTLIKVHIGSLEKRISSLEARVIQLEAENTILRTSKEVLENAISYDR